jgi:hypothetical protein
MSLSQFLPIRDNLKLVFRLVMRGQIGVWTGHHFADNCDVQTIQVHRLRIIQIPNSPGFSTTPFVLVSITKWSMMETLTMRRKKKNILFQLKQLTQRLGDEKDMQSCNSEACLWTCCKHRSVSPSFFLSQKSKSSTNQLSEVDTLTTWSRSTQMNFFPLNSQLVNRKRSESSCNCKLNNTAWT